jgi:CPA2 family monovalent cation:H+ antiporter-2
VGTGLAAAFGASSGSALFLGCVLALSSTAVVLRGFQERGEVDAPHARAALGILVVQDILFAPMILAVPLLAGARVPDVSIGQTLLYLGLLLPLAAAVWVVPRVLDLVVRTRDRDLFVISVVVIGLGIAWAASRAHLSLALGAFLAGLIISRSEYALQALTSVIPFRTVFSSFFFVSVGLLLDVRFALSHWMQILPLTLGIMVLKAVLVAAVFLVLRLPARLAAQTGLVLAQVGEFSFLLLGVGLAKELVTDRTYQMVLGAALLSMAATPFLLPLAERFGRRMAGTALPGRRGRASQSPAEPAEIRDHVLIVGYGLVGSNLAHACRTAQVPYLVAEMNPELVKRGRARSEPIAFGDAVHEAVLRELGVTRARVLVSAIADAAAARSITATAHRLNPALHIIVRTRYVREIAALRALGADEVIPEEFETSIEIFTRVLSHYLIPKPDIDGVAAEIRAEDYGVLRSSPGTPARPRELSGVLPGQEVVVFRVEEGAAAAGRTLAELDLRRRHRVTLLALRRADEVRANPSGGERLEPGDALVLLGSTEALSDSAALFSPRA